MIFPVWWQNLLLNAVFYICDVCSTKKCFSKSVFKNIPYFFSIKFFCFLFFFFLKKGDPHSGSFSCLGSCGLVGLSDAGVPGLPKCLSADSPNMSLLPQLLRTCTVPAHRTWWLCWRHWPRCACIHCCGMTPTTISTLLGKVERHPADSAVGTKYVRKEL